jgi:hypothetical protein
MNGLLINSLINSFGHVDLLLCAVQLLWGREEREKSGRREREEGRGR